MKVEIIPPAHWWKPTKYKTLERVESAGVVVPREFVTDGVTVSRWFVIPGLFLIAVAHFTYWWVFLLGVFGVLFPAMYPKVGRSFKAAVIHDYLLANKHPRKYADLKFKESLIEHGEIESWRIYMMYLGVRLYSLIKFLRNKK